MVVVKKKKSLRRDMPMRQQCHVLVRTLRGQTVVVDSNPSDSLKDFVLKVQQKAENIDLKDAVISLYVGNRCVWRPPGEGWPGRKSLVAEERQRRRRQQEEEEEEEAVVVAEKRKKNWEELAGRKHAVCPCRVEDCGIGPGSTVYSLLALKGGKGGFGSNLRAAGKHKLIDNFDACRDLQGRRVRHKTAEEKLAKWKAEEAERELEKVAIKHLKDVSKSQKYVEKEVDAEDLRAMKNETKQTLTSVKGAVAYALAKGAGCQGAENEGRKRLPLSRVFQDSDSSGDDDDDGYNGRSSGNDDDRSHS